MSLALTKLISSVIREAFMIKIRKVVTLPEIKEPETIYLHRDVTDALIITVTGVSGEALSSTKSTQDIDLLIKTYTDAEIEKVKTLIANNWTTVNSSHPGSWGGTIYLLQQRGTEWRIVKINSAGVSSYSYSTAESNLSYTIDSAWTNRNSLVYV